MFVYVSFSAADRRDRGDHEEGAVTYFAGSLCHIAPIQIDDHLFLFHVYFVR